MGRLLSHLRRGRTTDPHIFVHHLKRRHCILVKVRWHDRAVHDTTVWLRAVPRVRVLDRRVVGVFHQLQRQVSNAPLHSLSRDKWSLTVCCSGEMGQQSQLATCKEFVVRGGTREGDGSSVATLFCTGDCMTKSRECAAVACPDYMYRPSQWGACSATCGEDAVQTRTFSCVSSLGTTVSSSKCTDVAEPATTQSCGHGPCLLYECKTEPWSMCSITCSVRCLARVQ